MYLIDFITNVWRRGSCRSLPPVFIPRHQVVCPLEKRSFIHAGRRRALASLFCTPDLSSEQGFPDTSYRNRRHRHHHLCVHGPSVRKHLTSVLLRIAVTTISLHLCGTDFVLLIIRTASLASTSLSSFHSSRSTRRSAVALFSNGSNILICHCDCWPAWAEHGRCWRERAELQPLKHPSHSSYSAPRGCCP